MKDQSNNDGEVFVAPRWRTISFVDGVGGHSVPMIRTPRIVIIDCLYLVSVASPV